MEKSYTDLLLSSVCHKANEYLKKELKVLRDVEEGSQQIRKENSTLPTTKQD